MRKMAIFLLLLTVFSGYVSASTFNGLVSIPGKISFGDYTIQIGDVSMDDGSLMVTVEGPENHSTILLEPGKAISLGYIDLLYLKALVGGRNFVLLNVTFPDIVPGQRIVLNDYTIELVSIGPKGAKLRISYRGDSKEFTSREFTFGTLRVKANPYPKVFDGYMSLGQNVTVLNYTLTFSKASVENTSSGFSERVVFEYQGENYSVEVGKEADVGVFHVKVEDLVGLNYTKAVVNFKGASLSIETVVNKFSLSPGQSREIGPYVLKYEYPFGGAKVSLMNTCGNVLKEVRLTYGNVSAALYHGGVFVFLMGYPSDNRTKFGAIINENELPDVSKVANLLLNATSDVGKQYVPQSVRLKVKNTGTVTLSNITVVFVPGNHVEVLSKRTFHIRELKPGKETFLEVLVRPTESGNVTLGRFQATTIAPFELACGGYKTLNFESNTVISKIARSLLAFSVVPSLPERVTVYHTTHINVSVSNTGDVKVPANLTIRIPEGLAVQPGTGFELSEGYVRFPLDIGSQNNRTLSLVMIPYKTGNFTLEMSVVTPYGEANSTKVRLEVIMPPENEVPPGTTTTSWVNGTVTVTETATKTVTKTSTFTLTSTSTTVSTKTITVEYVPAKAKVLWMVLGVAIGSLALLTIAWYISRKS